MNVVFLVNGASRSAAGERARRIAAQFARSEVAVVYRVAGRAIDLPRYVREATRRPAVVYGVDLAVVPTISGMTGSLRGAFVVDTGDAPAAFFDLVHAGLPRRLAARVLERLAYEAADRIIVRGPYHALELQRRGY